MKFNVHVWMDLSCVVVVAFGPCFLCLVYSWLVLVRDWEMTTIIMRRWICHMGILKRRTLRFYWFLFSIFTFCTFFYIAVFAMLSCLFDDSRHVLNEIYTSCLKNFLSLVVKPMDLSVLAHSWRCWIKIALFKDLPLLTSPCSFITYSQHVWRFFS